MRNLLLIALLLPVVLIYSCKEYGYSKTNRRKHFVELHYDKNEKIIVKEAIICGNIGSVVKNKVIDLNGDSVLNVFLNSFEKLNIKLEKRTAQIICNRDFVTRRRLNFRKIKHSDLPPIAGNHDGLLLVPIINFNYIYLSQMYATSTGAVGGGGFSKNVHVDLALLLFRNQKLIYFKSMFFYSPILFVTDYRESIDFSIKQENIDTLVQLTMKDYLGRMK